MTDSLAPQKLRMDMEDIGLVECATEKAMLSAKFVIDRMSKNHDGFPENFFPLKTRVNAALLGALRAHDKIKTYHPHDSLQSIVEKKINLTEEKITVLAVNSSESFYCFSTKWFSYGQLLELKKKTHAIDFLVLLARSDGFFVFHDDDPACLVSFADERGFAENFVSSASANSIFQKQMMNWTITTLPSEGRWLNTVQDAVSHQ